jgi:hypothetical protein
LKTVYRSNFFLFRAENLALLALQNEVTQAVAVFGGGFEDVPYVEAIGDF